MILVLAGGFLAFFGGTTDRTTAWEVTRPLDVKWSEDTMRAFIYLGVPPTARVRLAPLQGRLLVIVGRPECSFVQIGFHSPGDIPNSEAGLLGDTLKNAIALAQVAIRRQAAAVRATFDHLAKANEVVTVEGAPFAVTPISLQVKDAVVQAAESRGVLPEPLVLHGRSPWGGATKGLAFRHADDRDMRLMVAPQALMGNDAEADERMLMDALAAEWPDIAGNKRPAVELLDANGNPTVH